jgi:hypothetical protein
MMYMNGLSLHKYIWDKTVDNKRQSKSKAVPLHAMEVLGGQDVQLLLILNLSTRLGWALSVTPLPRLAPGKKRPSVPIVQEAGWAPEPVWTQRQEEKSFRLFQGSNIDRLVIHSVVRHYTDCATQLTNTE